MLNVISILFGLFALVIALPGFVPFFGWLNWFVLPIAAVGLIIGVMSRSTVTVRCSHIVRSCWGDHLGSIPGVR